MSAIVCGKRSSIFEEIPSPSSSSSKRIRCSSSSPVRFSGSIGQSPFLLLEHLFAVFPHMDKKLIEQTLENNGHDLDLAIKSLNDLRLGCAGNVLGTTDSSSATHSQPSNQPQVHGDDGGSTRDPSVSNNLPMDGLEWVELFVREMSAASDVEDARIRASRALEAFEKTIRAHAKADTAQNFQQENSMLKEQVQALLQENGILKRAVSIQHERQKEFEVKSQEVQQLKQLLSQCQEHIRTLEVNNYALAMHLKQAEQNNSIPGRFNPDIF
ncbi:hypothetical protein BVRB_8g193840 [Beta vulgaris subsp. vulgaris]|uniref:uncharacterized protein LOC104901986 isoform X4 n=1 Tax=Beta vulgaris subsp. vulgaris TaxID=3555 RepID=UPI00053F6BA9|nr:uncharacterized protein LOC104901986 isoform X4 [Beta vulgaris subsp. vulgaris]KMT02800.1 hypothetical protein BVRB_8g193840 [Beta vulgaris subsp. vulgaris]